MLKMGKSLRRIWKWFAMVLVLIVVWLGHRAHGTIQSVQSASNLRDLGGALMRYANDHHGRFPDRLGDLFLDDPTLQPKLFIVPWGIATVDTGTTAQRLADSLQYGHCSYVYLGAGRTISDLRDDDVLMFEADGISPTGGTYCLYGDGHGEVDTTADAIQSIVATEVHANLASSHSAERPSTIATTRP